MKLIRREAIRRLMPAFIVGGILVTAFVATPSALAKSTGNCGVKAYGYATHDHGKPCPNRPFPGEGIGVIRIMAGLAGASTEGNAVTPATVKSKQKSNTASGTNDELADTSNGSGSTSHGHHNTSSKSHGHHGGRQI